VVDKGSQYVSNSNDVYDLFLTSAVTDGLKLWDLRSNRFVSLSLFRMVIDYYCQKNISNYVDLLHCVA